MSIKVCLLRTGETVIADVREVIDQTQNKALGYRIEHPYVVDYKFEEKLTLTENNTAIEGGDETPASYAFRSWCPLASGREFDLQYDFIDCIYDPHKVVTEAYSTIVQHYLEQHTNRVTVNSDKTVVTQGIDTTLLDGQGREEEIEA